MTSILIYCPNWFYPQGRRMRIVMGSGIEPTSCHSNGTVVGEAEDTPQ
jgi:hypothetical protein